MGSYKETFGDAIKKQFAKNLQEKLREYDMTQNELARRMGLNSSTVSDWCRGWVLPRSNRLEQLCTVLHCEPADLLGSVPDAVEEDLVRRLNELGVDPKVKEAADQRYRQIVESYQAISLAMSQLDAASMARLAAYAEGLLAASGKNKIS